MGRIIRRACGLTSTECEMGVGDPTPMLRMQRWEERITGRNQASDPLCALGCK